MYTIKEAAARTGVPVTSLRAWERRYGIVRPQRTESGYRLYDEAAIAALCAMRQLVEDGWSPATAAATIAKEGPESVLGPAVRTVVSSADPMASPMSSRRSDWRSDQGHRSGAVAYAEGQPLARELVAAAAAVDAASIESVLDRGFALGSFEAVVDGWLMPTLRAVGEAWAEGAVDVAGEHTASYAVMRRLGQAFAAASSLSDGPRVLVGLPSGSHHELGALAFATAARRRGLTVVYVGADLPVASWLRAVHSFPTHVAVIGVPTPADRATAAQTARALRETRPDIAVAAGGPHARHLAPGVVDLPGSVARAARAVEALGR